MSVTNFIAAILSIISVALISTTLFIDMDPELINLLNYFDLGLCVFFFGDFLNSLYKSKNKFEYFYKQGLVDLLSSVPVIQELRFARFLRVFRVFRLINSINKLTYFLKTNKKQTLYGSVLLLMVLSIFICTFAILWIEKDVGNIKTAEDSLWWAFITVTTVGYGDYYPVTNEGKLIAFFLIINGLVGFGALISYLNDSVFYLKDED
jgi:voltage-gated potassium channel